jgi:membrane-bound inhibitor of C-type lysozyme
MNYWFASDFKSGEDVKRICHNDTIRHGDFVIRVISWATDTTTNNIVIIGIQESYKSLVKSKYQDRIVWGPKGISNSLDEYRNGIYLPRA